MIAFLAFKLSSLTLLLAGSILASPHSGRSDGLAVKLVGPASNVHSVDDLVFTAHVTNTGPETVKILKYGTILDSLPTRSFTVTKNGTDVAFTGVKINVQLSDASYQTIASGETVSVTHKIASLYDFASAGLGTFSFAPITTFLASGVNNKTVPLSHFTDAPASSNSIDVEISGDVSKRAHPNLKRGTVVCSNSALQSFISSSYTEGKSLAAIASSYVTLYGATDSLYLSYFKNTPTSTVKSVLDRVANEALLTRTLNCADPLSVCNGNIIAYTVTATTNIYYCSIFYNEVATNRLCSDTSVNTRNIRGGTTLHELTHATSRTIDVVYGCPNDINLSADNSVINADSYNTNANSTFGKCFATQVYKNTQC